MKATNQKLEAALAELAMAQANLVSAESDFRQFWSDHEQRIARLEAKQ